MRASPVQLSNKSQLSTATRRCSSRLPRLNAVPSPAHRRTALSPCRCHATRPPCALSNRSPRDLDGDKLSRRGAAALLMVMGVALSPPSAGAASNPSESNCESCSNSNSSMQEGDKSFVTTASGLRYLDLKPGTGAAPEAGLLCVVDWVGYTAGYQAKRIESTRETDQPYRFHLGKGEAIAAFEEAVAGMRVGGVRRVEIPGELEEALGYPKDPSVRYSRGPEPMTFGGKRALDFVLDNKTLRDFNRTLLFDIRLDNVVR